MATNLERIVSCSVSLLLIAGACATSTVDPKPDEDEEPPPPVECQQWEALCGEVCVDVSQDPENCGACEVLCSASQTCKSSACVDCGLGEVRCGNDCANVATNPLHCGECFNACGDEQTCLDFKCACEVGKVDCSGTCIDTQTDPEHCGDCFTVCADETVCVDGDCKEDCGTLTECSGTCVDLQTDEDHCGSCPVVCDAGFECESGVCTCPTMVCGACNPQDLSGALPITISDSTFGEPDLLSSNCGGFGNGEIVYTFTAPQTGDYMFDTFGSGYDTVLYLLDDACTELTCNDDASGLDSAVGASLTLGDEILIVVDGLDEGSFDLHVTLATCPAQDLGNTVPQMLSDDTTGGSSILTADCSFGMESERTYEFTAPVAGGYVFAAQHDFADGVIEVRDATCGGTSLACASDDDMIGEEKVALALAQDQTVVVLVESYFFPGPFDLDIHAACPDDDLGTMVPQTVNDDTSTAVNFTAGTCADGDGPERSYTFTAPAAGMYTFDTSGTGFDTVVYVRDGACEGAELGCDDDSGTGKTGKVTLTLAMDQEVVVFVDGFFAASSGPFDLNITTP